MLLVTSIIVAAIFFLYPAWRISSRAGLPGPLSLVVLIPVLGPFVLLLILAFVRWPNRREVAATPSGRALFGMLGVFSEFEREMIVERTRAAIARARAEGKTLGRPRVSAETEDAIRELRAEGKGMTAISKALGVGCSTVTRVLAE